MKFNLFILLILNLAILGKTHAQLSEVQQKQVDSLKQVVATTKQDAIKISAWQAWDNIIYLSDADLDFRLNQKIDSLCLINLTKDLNSQEKVSFLTYRGEALNNLGLIYGYQGDYPAAVDCHNENLNIRKGLNDKEGIAASLNNLALIYQAKSEYGEATKYFNKSIELQKELGNKEGIAKSLNNLSQIYRDQADYSKAIDYSVQSLKIQEEIGDDMGRAFTLNAIGSVYKSQRDYDKAMNYYRQSLKIQEEIGYKMGIGVSYNNMGGIYKLKGEYEKAIDFMKRSLKIKEEINNRKGIANSLLNIGSVYSELEMYTQALDYFDQSLKIQEELGGKHAIANLLISISVIKRKQGDDSQALEYASRGLAIAQELGSVYETELAAAALWQINKKNGRFKESLEMYELYIQTRDSIESEENQKAIIRQEYKYEYEKQAAADSVKTAEAKKVSDAQLKATKAENARQKLEAEREEQLKYVLFGVLALAILFGLFIFNRFRVTRKQRDIIDLQKQEVQSQKEKVDEAYDQLEEKNTEILDSINYAKRIQSAILPPDKLVKQYLENSFILYKPKDIVAGDFYWMEPFAVATDSEGTSENGVLFAAADCTGHGVPGAMVSVVCNNGLNRSVREYGLTEPGQILDKTREIVISEFEKSEEEVKDGMDVALCSLQGRTLKYAGANNPLWIIRAHAANSSSDGANGAEEVEEIKAHKQPIGKYGEPTPYPTHTIELNEGDSFYIFSDGFADQFGGVRGKKFKTANFKRLLLSIQKETVLRQKELIDAAFEDWMGASGEPLEQLDDVCVIGVKVS